MFAHLFKKDGDLNLKRIPIEGQILEGKTLLLKPEILKPEYRDVESRKVVATGGFGCSPFCVGRAVFVRFVSDGEETRFSRNDFECIVEEDGSDTVIK